MVQRQRPRVTPKSVIVYAAALLILLWVGFPLYWLLKSSVTPERLLLTVPPDVLPPSPTLGYYLGMFHDMPGIDPGTGQQRMIPRALLNSIVIAAAVTVINIAVGAPAAYAFARFRFPLRNVLVNGLLASRMVPSLALLVPFYLLFRSLNLIDTIAGVILAHVAISLPFTVWILRGHFDNVPIEIEKAARVDGCSLLRVLWHVALPLAMPGLVVAGLFAFMLSWNEFTLALILTESPASLPVQPTLAGLSSYQGVSYGFLFAGSVLAAIPPALIALMLQRRMTGGLLEGSVK